MALEILVDGPCIAAHVCIRRLCFVCARKECSSPVAQRDADGPSRAVGGGFAQGTDQAAAPRQTPPPRQPPPVAHPLSGFNAVTPTTTSGMVSALREASADRT